MNMNISGNVKEVDVEELTECPECDSEHIVRDYKRGEVTCLLYTSDAADE